MQDKLNNLKKEILDSLEKARDSKVVRELEVQYLGRKGELTKVLRNLKNLDPEQKKEIGQLANEIKNELLDKFKEARNVVMGSKPREVVDMTLPGEKQERGHLNLLTTVRNELEDLFTSLGFMVLDGPELESEYYNFEALNIPKTHPARDIQDTFYVDSEGSGLVMRTHTSPMQIRAMQKHGAPIRCIVPGRVFRCEATDACHEHTFYQLEGLMVSEDISIANFKAVIAEMLSGMFKQDLKVRLRPGYFPFVEPGFEIDMSCTICGGKGCPSCKHSGWCEMMGAGMVHPNVLKAGGVDPKKFSGFAFGMGIERLIMMRYGIDDIRLFHSGDLRFLQQF